MRASPPGMRGHGKRALVATSSSRRSILPCARCIPESVPRVLVSDTVGFIKNLPHGLFASFKSTLDEALEASLLAHVGRCERSGGVPAALTVTEQVLEDRRDDVPRLLVFNKIDRGGDEAALRAKYPGAW